MLRFDLITASKAGHTLHPQVVMKELGYKVLGFEGVPIADCVFIEVEEIIEPLPPFLEKTDFKFSAAQ